MKVLFALFASFLNDGEAFSTGLGEAVSQYSGVGGRQVANQFFMDNGVEAAFGSVSKYFNLYLES